MKKIITLMMMLLLTLSLAACGNPSSEDVYEDGSGVEDADTEEAADTEEETDIEEETDLEEDADLEEETDLEEDADLEEETNLEEETDLEEDADLEEETDSEDDQGLNLETIIAETYAATGLEFPMCMNQPLTKENQVYMLGTDTFDFIEGVASEPMMSAQAHSFVLFTVAEDADIESIKEAVKANVDGRKWICVGVEPENIIVDSIGQMIILIMDHESQAIHEALLQVMQ